MITGDWACFLISYPSSLGFVTHRNRLYRALIQLPTSIPPRCKIPRTPAGPLPHRKLYNSELPSMHGNHNAQRCPQQKSKRYFISRVSSTVRSKILTSCGTEKTIKELEANWIWVPNWTDSSNANTAGKIVHFTRHVNLSSQPTKSILYFSADTRYKLFVNGKHVAVGPTRSSPLIWYYDTLDIAPYLKEGQNEIRFVVVRYFAASRSAMPFVRTALPGLTVIGKIETGQDVIDFASSNNWMASVDESIQFPMGLVDDVFLHVRLVLDRSSPPELH